MSRKHPYGQTLRLPRELFHSGTNKNGNPYTSLTVPDKIMKEIKGYEPGAIYTLWNPRNVGNAVYCVSDPQDFDHNNKTTIRSATDLSFTIYDSDVMHFHASTKGTDGQWHPTAAEQEARKKNGPRGSAITMRGEDFVKIAKKHQPPVPKHISEVKDIASIAPDMTKKEEIKPSENSVEREPVQMTIFDLLEQDENELEF